MLSRGGGRCRTARRMLQARPARRRIPVMVAFLERETTGEVLAASGPGGCCGLGQCISSTTTGTRSIAFSLLRRRRRMLRGSAQPTLSQWHLDPVPINAAALEKILLGTSSDNSSTNTIFTLRVLHRKPQGLGDFIYFLQLLWPLRARYPSPRWNIEFEVRREFLWLYTKAGGGDDADAARPPLLPEGVTVVERPNMGALSLAEAGLGAGTGKVGRHAHQYFILLEEIPMLLSDEVASTARGRPSTWPSPYLRSPNAALAESWRARLAEEASAMLLRSQRALVFPALSSWRSAGPAASTTKTNSSRAECRSRSLSGSQRCRTSCW